MLKNSSSNLLAALTSRDNNSWHLQHYHRLSKASKLISRMWHANCKLLPLEHSVWIYHSISTSDVLYRAMLSHISETAADTAWLKPDKSTNTCMLCRFAAWRAFYLDFGPLQGSISVFHLPFQMLPISFFSHVTMHKFSQSGHERTNAEYFSCMLLFFDFYYFSSLWEFECMHLCMWVFLSVADFGIIITMLFIVQD